MKNNMDYEIYRWSAFFIIFYFLIINTFYGILIIFSIPAILSRFKMVEVENCVEMKGSKALPSITIIMPCYNEENSIVESVRGVLELYYPTKEIIVVDDGSTDESVQKLIHYFDLVEIFSPYVTVLKTKPVQKILQSKRFSNFRVMCKEHGGKSDSVNAGINLSASKFFLVVDADTILEQDALLHMIRPFFTDPYTVAQGGTIRILNGCTYDKGRIQEIGLPKNLWAGIQVVEYLRAFLYCRLGWNYLGGNLIVSGAFGMFNKKKIIECGGYDLDSVTEDLEITVRIMKDQRQKNKKSGIFFIPDPVAWTTVPENLRSLSRQRTRWHYGLIDVMLKNKDMLFNPRYGMTGMIAMPFFFFGEFLEPFFEFLGYLIIFSGSIMGYLSWKIVFWFLFITWLLNICLTLISIFLEISTFQRYRKGTHFLRLFMYSICENFGFRQVTLFWRLRSFISYFRKRKVWK